MTDPLRSSGILHHRVFRCTALAVALATLAGPVGRSQTPTHAKKGEKKSDTTRVRSQLNLTLPQGDAELQIEGKPTRQHGTLREFETPEIQRGKPYEYTFSVLWRPNNYTVLTRIRTVPFEGGNIVNVDLSKPHPRDRNKAIVRWIATPNDIVAEMIKLARITTGDVVYEPGSGDGRILIAAVKAGARKGVGIELDRKRVAEATENVQNARLTNRITIRQGDALEGRDYREASVVFLFMGNEFNNLLRPVLEKQLKAGTRIVSHRYLLGDWPPDRTITVTGADGDDYPIHLWIVKEKKGDRK